MLGHLGPHDSLTKTFCLIVFHLLEKLKRHSFKYIVSRFFYWFFSLLLTFKYGRMRYILQSANTWPHQIVIQYDFPFLWVFSLQATGPSLLSTKILYFKQILLRFLVTEGWQPIIEKIIKSRQAQLLLKIMTEIYWALTMCQTQSLAYTCIISFYSHRNSRRWGLFYLNFREESTVWVGSSSLLS